MAQRRVVPGGAPGNEGSAAVSVGGLVFVSAVRGTGGAGADIGSQTKTALGRLKTSLEAAGSSLAQATAVHVYLKQASDFDAMNAAYREVFAQNPPTRTTVVSTLTDGALIEIGAIALPNGAARETMLPDGWMKSPRPYSYIIRTSEFVFLSGLVSRRGTDDQAVGGPVATQVKTILDNAGELLKTAGLSYKDVVSSRVFITDAASFAEMNDEYRKYFTTEPPVRATVVTGLMGTSAVEIALIASRVGKQVIGPASTLPLSSGIRAGKLVFLAGTLGNTDANATDVAAQTRETLARIGKTLTAAGLTFADVADNLVYLPDLSMRAKVAPILRELFPKDPPATTIAGTKLVAATGLIEIMSTAGK